MFDGKSKLMISVSALWITLSGRVGGFMKEMDERVEVSETNRDEARSEGGRK